MLEKFQNLLQKLQMLWISDRLCCEQGLRAQTRGLLQKANP